MSTTPKDLGTYYARVDLVDGRSWLDRWDTRGRFDHVGDHRSTIPTGLTWQPPNWSSDEEVVQAIRYQYLDGNYSCDCNKTLALARRDGRPMPSDPKCGSTLAIRRLAVVRPDGVETELWNSGQE